jgi:hypothetical protein
MSDDPFALDYSKLPEKFQDGMQNYIEKGYPPGHFLSAVIQNDLSKAIGYADPESLTMIPTLCEWIFNRAPSKSWGSRIAMEKWVAAKQGR